MSDTPTPRTDAFAGQPKSLECDCHEAIDFARQLERELAAAIAERDAAELKLAHAQHDAFYFERYMNEARECLREAVSYAEHRLWCPAGTWQRWRKAAGMEGGK